MPPHAGKALFVLLLSVVGCNGLSEVGTSVRGQVTDAATGSPIAGATIALPPDTTVVGMTDASGHYVAWLGFGQYRGPLLFIAEAYISSTPVIPEDTRGLSGKYLYDLDVSMTPAR